MFDVEEPDRRVENEESGMDMGVSAYSEVSGPLGGTSVEYRIRVKTTRPEYKSSFQRDTTVVDFTVRKTFKEIEYFVQKLRVKYADVVTLPSIACDGSPLNEDREMRKKVTNDVLSFVAAHKALASSALLFTFFGYDPNKGIEQSDSKVEISTESRNLAVTNVENSEGIFVRGQRTDEDDDDDEDLFKEFRRHGGGADSSSTLFAPSSAEKSRFQSRQGDPFLFTRQDMGGALRADDKRLAVTSSREVTNRSKAKEEEEEEDLGDTESKLNVEDLEKLLTIDDSLSDIWKEMKPKRMAVVEPSKGEPEVRSKPVAVRKPTLPPKPALKPTTEEAQPVPAPRGGRPIPTPRRPSSATSAQTGQPETADLSTLDILSYIDSEQQQQQQQNLNLFS